ncbi:TIGR02594 family protein [Primorskyibacter sedentarius]|uniref:TIGR02594 family protein n=1 Tax=Primorskyibacter sedentarius TaxID=745311 RepID=UPI003EB845C8
MSQDAYQVAERFIGLRELPGDAHHPFIQWGLMLCKFGHDAADEVPWCSAFVNAIAFICGLERTQSARARSWLLAGKPVHIEDAEIGDVVILKRGTGDQPGPEVIEAPGHVGFFGGIEGDKVVILGGNQSDSVNVSRYPLLRVLGVRRLA